jgi:hypothetical protein
MRRFVTILILTITMATSFGQVVVHDSLAGNGSTPYQPKKFSYRVSLGSEFTTAGGYGSALSTFVTPQVSYSLNKRLSIGGGISVVQTNYFDAKPLWGNEQISGYCGNFTSAVIFVNGQYLVSDRLSITGSAYKQIPISQDPLPYNPFNPVSARGAQGFNVNVGYRIGEHVMIEAGFRYSDGINPYNANPFYRNSSVYDPFGSPYVFGSPRW